PVWVEKLAVVRVYSEDVGEFLVADEGAEGGLEALPQVSAARLGSAALGEVAKSGDRVGVTVYLGGIMEETALLGVEEEEDPVEDGEQLPVEHPAEARVVAEPPPQGGITFQDAVEEMGECLPYL